MTIIAELPDGRRMEFPDETPDSVVQNAVKRELQRNPGKLTQPIDQAMLQGSPVQGMSAMDMLKAGVGRGMTELGRGVAQLTGNMSTGEYKDARALDQPLLNTPAGSAGSFMGELAGVVAPGAALNLAGRMSNVPALARAGSALVMPKTPSSGAMSGAVTGALQPTDSMGNKPTQIGLGALLGGGVASIPGLMRGVQDPQVQTLVKEGVTPTVGQLAGGAIKRVEEGLTSVPFVGDIIKSSRRRAIDTFDEAALNRVLSPIGMKLPKDKAGREAIDYVESTLSSKYDSLLPKLSAKADVQFLNDVSNATQRATTLTPEKATQLRSILNSQLWGRFTRGQTGGSAMNGETLKKVESELGRLQRNFRSSAVADDREMSLILQDVQSSLRDLIGRNNPQYAKELAPINEGWANFVRVQRAALTNDGTFTPAQLARSVKSQDKSRNKGAYARGDALMQDLAESGQSVLGSTVPDSGTPFRAMTAAGVLGGGAGYAVDPVFGLLAGATPLMYTPAGQRLMVQLAARRPQLLKDLGDVTARVTPYVNAPALAAGQ